MKVFSADYTALPLDRVVIRQSWKRALNREPPQNEFAQERSIFSIVRSGGLYCPRISLGVIAMTSWRLDGNRLPKGFCVVRVFYLQFARLAMLTWALAGIASEAKGQYEQASAGSFDPYASPTATAGYSSPDAAAYSGAPYAAAPRRSFDFLPDGLIYRPYLAGPKESRTGIQIIKIGNDWVFDSSIGGQWGVLRYGTSDPSFPLGLQLDIEASAQLRHRQFGESGFLASDYRVGVPLSFSRNNHKTKFGVYFLRANPSEGLIDRISSLWTEPFFSRNSLVLGHSIYLTKRFRVYGEAGYAFQTEVSDPWEFQFGAEYAPICPTGLFGAPFLAANLYLREELDYGGTFTAQAGWAWRKKRGRLFRLGIQYANGKSNQLSLHDWNEQQIGFGIWHDY